MKIKIFDNTEQLHVEAANAVIKELSLKPNLNLGLAAGHTPIRLYEKLMSGYKQGIVSFKQSKTFNLDEYVGLASEDKQSFSFFMKKYFLNNIDIESENIHALNGVAKDLNKECECYEQEIVLAGGIDLQILGLGENGHIGFNEPGSLAESRTRVVNLSETTLKNMLKSGALEKSLPKQGITIGIGTILNAKKIILIATGSSKAEAVRQCFDSSPALPEWPASFLKSHKNCFIYLDKEAAKNLDLS